MEASRPVFDYSLKLVPAMNNDINGDVSDQNDDVVLTFDVPDEALERAASVGKGGGITLGYCTYWYYCRWPM